MWKLKVIMHAIYSGNKWAQSVRSCSEPIVFPKYDELSPVSDECRMGRNGHDLNSLGSALSIFVTLTLGFEPNRRTHMFSGPLSTIPHVIDNHTACVRTGIAISAGNQSDVCYLISLVHLH